MNQMFFGNARIMLFNSGSSTPELTEHADTWIKFSENDTWHEYDIEGAMDCPALIAAGLMPEGSGEIELAEWTIQPYAVEIGTAVTSIGNFVFFNCIGLKSVTIPNSVRSIGNQAFLNCVGLTSMTIPDSVTSIGGGAFHGCMGLADDNGFVIVKGVLYSYYGDGRNITVPDGVTRIDIQTFMRNRILTSVTIPDSVISIGKLAFNGCSGLTSVTIPNSVTSIESNAFHGCNITSVAIVATGKPEASAETVKQKMIDAGVDPNITWIGVD